jgi:transposase InsO family protein
VKGPFPSVRLPEETKVELAKVIEDSKRQGIARVRSCELLQVSIRRVERWRASNVATGSMSYDKQGPKRPWNAVMPQERDAVRAFVAPEETVDLSLQAIAIKGGEQGLFFLSASSVRSILAADGLLADRRSPVRGHGGRVKPARPAVLDGPNQCWCWDISYILTEVPRWVWYLYVMLDEWSRKVVAWRVVPSLAAEEAKQLCNDAVVAEGLLDIPPAQMPKVVNDRGVQMTAKPVMQMFSDLGMLQLFARPHTPNDNAFAESLFSTVKTAHGYPQFFPALEQRPVLDYFSRLFPWYNNEHYHSRIGYVHPIDMHEGRAPGILEQRKHGLAVQHGKRKTYWTDSGAAVPATGAETSVCR